MSERPFHIFLLGMVFGAAIFYAVCVVMHV